MPFHVRITHRDPLSRSTDTLALDKDEDWLLRHVVEPREQGRATFIGGQVIDWDDVDEIHITQTDQPSIDLLPAIKARLEQTSWYGAADAEWHLARDATDVTEQFMTGPPGTRPAPTAEPVENTAAVMVVHGHDQDATNAMFDWLRSIGLKPREWNQLVRATRHGSPFIGDVLEQAFREAQAVLVLFTPDERAAIRPDLAAGAQTWRFQARPNVLFEAGMALATHPARTVLVVLGSQELPSDLAGRHYVRLDSPAALQDIAQRLSEAGCPVDLSGSHWLDDSRFPVRDDLDESDPNAGGEQLAAQRRSAYETLLTAHGAMVQANSGQHVYLNTLVTARFRFDEAQSAAVMRGGPKVQAAAEALRQAWSPTRDGQYMAGNWREEVEQARRDFLLAVAQEANDPAK